MRKNKKLFISVFLITLIGGLSIVAAAIFVQQRLTTEADDPAENHPSVTTEGATEAHQQDFSHLYHYNRPIHVMTLEEMHIPLTEVIPNWPTPSVWDDTVNVVLYLNETGANGTHIKNGPSLTHYSTIEILWDNAQLVYLHFFVPDADEAGVYWLHVLTPSGTEGYVDSRLVGVVE